MHALVVVFLVALSTSAANKIQWAASVEQRQEFPLNTEEKIPLTSSDFLNRKLSPTRSLVAAQTGATKLTTTSDVVEWLQDQKLEVAASWAEMIDLNSILNDEYDTFTIFVPTDEAFKKWEKDLGNVEFFDIDVMTELWRSWIIPTKIYKADIKDEVIEISVCHACWSSLTSLRFNVYQGQGTQKITVNGAEIAEFDNQVTNGLVHVTNRVIYPIEDNTIMGTLREVPQFSTFVRLVQNADSQWDLDLADGLTVFVPTNEAFTFLDEDYLNDLKKDAKKARAFVRQHVVMTGTLYTAGLWDGLQKTTWSNDQITFNKVRDRIVLNQSSNIVYRDMPACNGVFHVVDKVVKPTYQQSQKHLTWF